MQAPVERLRRHANVILVVGYFAVGSWMCQARSEWNEVPTVDENKMNWANLINTVQCYGLKKKVGVGCIHM